MRVVLVDGHPTVRMGLRLVLRSLEAIEAIDAPARHGSGRTSNDVCREH
jgi:hypothetical protein